MNGWRNRPPKGARSEGRREAQHDNKRGKPNVKLHAGAAASLMPVRKGSCSSCISSDVFPVELKGMACITRNANSLAKQGRPSLSWADYTD